MSELPKGWVFAPLDKAIAHDTQVTDGDWVESKDQDPNGDVRLIQLADVGDGRFNNKSSRFMTSSAAKRLNCTYLEKGDLLIARMPDPLGRACIFPGVESKAVTVVDVCLVRESELSALKNSILKYWINSPYIRNLIAANASGSTRKRITRKKLEKFEFPIPPLNEQQRIVEKLDEVLAQVDAIKGRLDSIPTIIKRFCQSVLAAAVSGKLTEQWRGENSYSAFEQLTELQSLETEYISKKLKDERTKILKEKSKLRKECEQFSQDNVPAGWARKPFFEFCLLNRGFDLPTAKRVEGEYPIMSSGGLIGTHNEYKVEAPVITVGRSGSVGKVFYSDLNSWPLNTSLYVKNFGICDPKYLYLALKSSNLEQYASSSAVPSLNRNEFMFVETLIPPKEEQKEIVRLVDEYFALADTIEAQVNKARARVDNLTQSILAKAFRGELVPQDDNDEPADKLLERIAQAKAEAEALAKAAKKAETAKKRAAKTISK
ncbi:MULTISPECIES: restriction endonuclease subunit S [unclassified Pseudoalteromonas]|uniref:restriction endonuclease subunit S n=1 Tax=unclassified Pseudoalteromonas TaxID=194690 RepID=UPI0013EE7B14